MPCGYCAIPHRCAAGLDARPRKHRFSVAMITKLRSVDSYTYSFRTTGVINCCRLESLERQQGRLRNLISYHDRHVLNLRCLLCVQLSHLVFSGGAVDISFTRPASAPSRPAPLVVPKAATNLPYGRVCDPINAVIEVPPLLHRQGKAAWRGRATMSMTMSMSNGFPQVWRRCC